MKIHDRKGVLDPRVGGPDAIQSESLRGPAAPGPGSPDQVSVSELGRSLARFRAEVGDVNEIRDDRVRGLQAVMAKGQYSADIRDVARKLLRELLGQVLG
jgi:anti-sigma28 factor (negative regulator of flagellin synthesis)